MQKPQMRPPVPASEPSGIKPRLRVPPAPITPVAPAQMQRPGIAPRPPVAAKPPIAPPGAGMRMAAPKRQAGEAMTVSQEVPATIEEYGAQVVEALKEGKETLAPAGHYELVRVLGEGGMGTVFLGNHISVNEIAKPVAIKVIKDSHDERAIRRLIDESKMLTRLSQGNIVEFLALESKELSLPGRRNSAGIMVQPPRKAKLYFMVMEYVNGPSLEGVMKRHLEKLLLINPTLAAFIVHKACIALSEAHNLTDDAGRSLNLAHRDISPGNILIMARAGITKLADFGVAKAFGDFDGGAVDEKRVIVGKPKYMAPEQLEGFAAAKSDIWSLGVVAYEVLTGYPPYRVFGNTLRSQVENLRRQFAHPLRKPSEVISAKHDRFSIEVLSDIIMSCLNFDPDARPTANQLANQLERQYLYAKGLGPTNKSLSAYLRLLEYAVGEGEVMPPAGYAEGEDAKTLCATLWLDDPLEAMRRRYSSSYNPDFVRAIKANEFNPCLLPLDGVTLAIS